MKNIKRLALFFTVGLVLFSAVAGLIPFTQGRASAFDYAPGSWLEQASVSERVQMFQYIGAMSRCLHENRGETVNISPGDIENYKLITSGETIIGSYMGQLGIPIPDDDNDGKVTCQNNDDQGRAWLQGFISMLIDTGVVEKWTGQSTTYAAACLMGWHDRNKAPFEQSPRDCANGSASLLPPVSNGNKDDLDYPPNEFKILLLTYLGGKNTTDAYDGMLNAPEKYFFYSQNFRAKCLGIDAQPAGVYDGPSDEDKAATREFQSEYQDDDSNVFRVSQIDADGKVRDYVYLDALSDRDQKVSIGVKTNFDEWNYSSCHALQLKADEFIEAAADYFKDNPEQGDPLANLGRGSDGVDDGDSPFGTGANTLEIECSTGIKEVVTNPIDWLTCAVVKGLYTFSAGLENVIVGMLCINETDIFANSQMTCSTERGSSGSQEGFYNAWNVFRILAMAMIAIAGLVMVISQGLGFEIVDAYTVKKVLPRILIAGIGISLSWPLLEFMITLSNAFGVGVRNLIYAPFQGVVTNSDFLSGGDAVLGALFAGGAFAALGALGLLSFIATAALALLVAFIVLVLRNILIIMLVVFAPLAIAMYTLPNTEKYWKTWWDWLTKALLVFPIITAMIAVGHVFAAVTLRKDSALSTFIAFVAYFAPYFLIPAAFRFAGGALATIGGFANDRSRGAFDRLSKFRKGQSEHRLGYYGRKYGDRIDQGRAQLQRSANEYASSRGGLRGRLAKGLAGGIQPIGGIEERMSAINARTAKRLNDTIATGADSRIRGLTVNKKAIDNMGWDRALAASEAAAKRGDTANQLVRMSGGKRQYKSLGGSWIDEADVVDGHREWGRDVAAQQAAVSYEMRKALTDEQVQGVSARYAALAKDQFGMTDTQADGAWIGAAFENQNTHLQYKHTAFDYNTRGPGKLKNGGASLIQEAYEKKGSYQLSQMSANTIEQLNAAFNNTTEGSEEWHQARAVAETFMHQLGANPTGKDGELQPDDKSSFGARRSVSSNGSGAVAEAVYKFARNTGVAKDIPGAPSREQRPGSPHTG